MNIYENGKIYKIIDNTNNDIYIGSTTNKYLCNRLAQHKHNAYNDKRANLASKQIILNGDYKIILIENYSCKTKDELRAREQYYIDKFDCINKISSYNTKEDIRQKCLRNNAIYRNKNREYINGYHRTRTEIKRMNKISLDIFC